MVRVPVLGRIGWLTRVKRFRLSSRGQACVPRPSMLSVGASWVSRTLASGGLLILVWNVDSLLSSAVRGTALTRRLDIRLSPPKLSCVGVPLTLLRLN